MSSSTQPPAGPRHALEGFLPNGLLASLVARGQAAMSGGLLTTADGASYVLEDAVRVLECATRHTDPFGYIGMVEPVRSLLERGFIVSSQRIALDRTAYDIELGVIAHPLSHRAHCDSVRQAS